MELIDGSISVDDRGSISFVNGFDFRDVKRFYMVQNHSKGFIRAWHGHKQEGKYVFVTKGAIIMATVSMETEKITKYVLSATKPQILYIPAGNYNGFRTLTDDTQIMFFSTSSFKDSLDDDFRKPANTWQVFEVISR